MVQYCILRYLLVLFKVSLGVESWLFKLRSFFLPCRADKAIWFVKGCVRLACWVLLLCIELSFRNITVSYYVKLRPVQVL